MPDLQANGITLHYQIQGQGPPLALIAGLGYSHWMWRLMAPLLAEQFQVITFDNRGVGCSDKPPGPYSAQMLAADTVGLLQALDLPHAAIMGHSMGGFVAQALVLDYPQMVDRLILSATNFGGPNHVPITPEAMAVMADVSGDAEERFYRGLSVSTAPGFAQRRPELVAQWLAHRQENPPQPDAYQAQLGVGLGLLSADAAFEDRLAQVQVPTLILSGEHDRVVPPQNAALLTQKIPGSILHILPGAGHFFPLEKPAEAARVIMQFLHEKSGNEEVSM
jgi:pimeloyl-ACP methyl ester carboxylesterase